MTNILRASVHKISFLLLLALCIGYSGNVYGANQNDVDDEKEGSYPTSGKTPQSPDCDYQLLTKLIINAKKPKKSTLHIHCKKISTRTIFEDFLTAKQLQKAGFAGIRSHDQLIKAKNLIDTAFTSSDKNISMELQLVSQKQAELFLQENESSSDDADDVAPQDNQLNLGKKPQKLKLPQKVDPKVDLEDKVLAMHLIKDDHFMLLECKLVLKQVVRNKADILEEVIKEMKHHLMPAGTIVMWSGKRQDIPKGWVLCDGNNNTPDLRNRFIVGAGNSYSSGTTGGSTSHDHSVSVHGHQLSISEMPSHSHKVSFGYKSVASGRGNCPLDNRDGTYDVTSKSTGGSQAHSHGASCDSTSTLPPYYAMCFIMLKTPPKYTI